MSLKSIALGMIMLLHEVETNFNVRIPQEQTSQFEVYKILCIF